MEILYLEKITIIEETPIYVCIFVFRIVCVPLSITNCDVIPDVLSQTFYRKVKEVGENESLGAFQHSPHSEVPP